MLFGLRGYPTEKAVFHHAHVGAASDVSRLGVVLESIIQLDKNETLLSSRARSDSSYSISKMDSVSIRCDELVVGALEAAFVDMDSQIAEDKQTWRNHRRLCGHCGFGISW
ncbi:hypothetical protein COOONC_27783 [Cooperia oncophora]